MSDDLVKRLRSGLSDFDDWDAAADRIEELEAVVKEAMIQGLSDLGSDYEIDCATKEEWAQRAFSAEARIKELEAKLADCEARLVKAVEQEMVRVCNAYAKDGNMVAATAIHDAWLCVPGTLTELKGQDDE